MFINTFKKRLSIIFIVFILLFILIFIKVFYLKVISYNKINILANDLWSRNLPIGANRGIIYDRNGKVLASNVTTTSLVVIPSQIKDKELVSKNIAKILNTSYKNIYGHVSKKTSIEIIHPEGRQLSYEIADKINNLNYEGVYLLKESKRVYLYNNLLSHVLGYVGIDNQGLSGLELFYNEYLTGQNGMIKYYSDGQGKKVDRYSKYVEGMDGMNLTLTIDLDIQKSVEKELDNIVIKYQPEQAFVIVADPTSGEILAMASRPDFNPNNYKEYNDTIINRNLPIFNTYEPGSTFKIISLSAALNENKISFDDHFYDAGGIYVAGQRIKCWKKGGHGSETMLEVVMNSCNPGFVYMGQKLGVNTLMKYIKNFGFGSKTGIDINGEENGILFKEENMGPLELATTSFGQGVSVTAIQQVMGASAAINGGILYTPYLVKSISAPNTNETIVLNNIKEKRRVISEETSEMVRYALENVVARGTGRNAYIEGYRIGGKTGTAQKVANGVYLDNNYILSFIGFMNANDPKYIVYVAIDHPKGITQYGGTASAPVAKNIFKDIISIKNLKKEEGDIKREYLSYETKYVKIPNLIGLRKIEARNILIKNNLFVEYSGTGNEVIMSSPKEGEYVKEGSIVKIMLK